MKLAIFAFALVGAILALPQDVPQPAGERTASPQDKPQQALIGQDKPQQASERTAFPQDKPQEASDRKEAGE